MESENILILHRPLQTDVQNSEKILPTMCDALLRTTIPATFVSHMRSRTRTRPRYAILRINKVSSREAAKNYLSNVVYFRWTNKKGEHVENWGHITSVHGRKGAVKAIFERNLCPSALGQTVHVKLYKTEAADNN